MTPERFPNTTRCLPHLIPQLLSDRPGLQPQLRRPLTPTPAPLRRASGGPPPQLASNCGGSPPQLASNCSGLSNGIGRAKHKKVVEKVVMAPPGRSISTGSLGHHSCFTRWCLSDYPRSDPRRVAAGISPNRKKRPSTALRLMPCPPGGHFSSNAFRPSKTAASVPTTWCSSFPEPLHFNHRSRKD